MTEFSVEWFLSAVFLVTADIAWLGVIARKYYRRQIGHIMAKRINSLVALAFYVVYSAGVAWFAVRGADGWQDAARTGALFGFFCYATYNLTNLATLRGWPAGLTVVDLLWGTAMTAFVAGAASALSPMVIGSFASSVAG